MKKIISFEKKQTFPTMIGEISAISLEHDLKFIDEANITGNLYLTGKYKMTEASQLEDDFSYEFPIEVSLTEKVLPSSGNIEINDFYYDLENKDTIICHIEIKISGIEILEDLQPENRECDGETIEKEIEIPIIEKKEEKNQEIIEENDLEQDIESLPNDNNKSGNDKLADTEYTDKTEFPENNKQKQKSSSFFINLEDDEDTYGTFTVYVVAQNESLNEIIEKYQTSIEELEKYNNLDIITTGTKLIIPYKND